MSIILNGTEIGAVNFNNTEINTVNFNGVNVFQAGITATPNEYFTFTLLSDDTYSIKAKDSSNMPADVVLPSKYEDKLISTVASEGFYNCHSITSIIVPKTYKKINRHAFGGTSITSINWPKNITTIDQSTFTYCTKLSSFDFSNIIIIGGSSFRDCSSLTSIAIPNSVTNIGSNAFAGCSNLETIVVDSSNPIYDSRDNCNAIIKTANNELIRASINTIIPSSVKTLGPGAFFGLNIRKVEIPPQITDISGECFKQCRELVDINLSESQIKLIGTDSFFFCKGLTNVNCPITLERIGGYAFAGCSNIQSFSIERNITRIDAYAFNYCSSLTQLTCRAETPPTLGPGVFNGVPTTMQILVPSSSVEAYKAAAGWSDRAEYITAIPE